MSFANALYAGAVAAMRSSRRCEREASRYDLFWHEKRMADAQENRERAIDYLKWRRRILDDLQQDREQAA